MSSQRFVAGVPMKIWFWLILFMCCGCGLVASLKCKDCVGNEECEKAEPKECEELGTSLKSLADPACETKYGEKGDNIISVKCGSAEKGSAENHCTGKRGQGQDCTCSTDGCIAPPSAAGTGTKLKLWSNLRWIGLACVQTATAVVLH